MKLISLALCASALAIASGCDAVDASRPGNALATDHAPHNPAEIPPGVDTENGRPDGVSVSQTVGRSCSSGDTHHMCVALKYVVYVNGSGNPVVSRQQAIDNVQAINADWAQCDIEFQIDQFQAIKPADHGLRYNTATYDELDAIRGEFGDDRTLLIATTGPWSRASSLGSTGANAWTNMPGGDVFGAVLESTVGTFGHIIAHEIGHYLNLDHVGNSANLMNPVIYDNSSSLSANQCANARSAINYFWPRMKR